MILDEFSADRGVQFYTIGRNPGRSASTGGGRSDEARWELGGYRQSRCSVAPVSAVLEWRGVGANHRPEVGAEGNATVVCSAQSLATGLGGDGSLFVFSAQQLFYNVSHSTASLSYVYFSTSSDNLCMMKIY